MDVSLFHLYSLGVVTKDKVENDNYISVTPIEHIPDVDSEYNDVEVTTVETLDIDGNNKSIIVDKSSTIQAKWLPDVDTNRAISPDVCKGETVKIYRYSDTDEYYWTTLYNQFHYRKKEKDLRLYSNRDSIEEKQSVNDMYYTLMDTINKLCKIHTADNNGELTTYDFEVNTKDGVMLITDGRGNKIELTSRKDLLTIKTNKKVHVITTDVVVDASKSVTVNSPEVTINSTNTTINADKNVNINCTTANVKCSDMNVNAGSSTTIKSPNITLDGEVTTTKNVNIGIDANVIGMVNGSGFGAGGAPAVAGGLSTATAEISGDANIGGISFKDHVHDEGGETGGTTTPPK
jgi:hypothetical protein